MNDNVVIDIAREALMIVIKTSAPMLLISLVIGLIVSIFQTITSIQEQTLTFVPKFIAVFVIIMLCGGWILTTLRDYMINLFTNFGYYISNL
jgi:flagellar biosynthetic protein FliQ